MSHSRDFFLLPLLASVLLLLNIWMYWPGAAGPEILDDRSNVAVLTGLDEAPDIASDYVFGNRSGPLGRPVSMYTFVLEELYFAGDTALRKQANIVLHAFNGVLVMWLLARLLGHAGIVHYRWFALVGGALWLFSPLYVSTVLYVVQRMAMMSTLFMLLALIAYTYWRNRLFRSAAGFALFGLMLLSIALAVLSKENGVVVVPIIVVLEVLWFGGRNARGEVDQALRRASRVLLCVGVVAAALFLVFGYDYFARGYWKREFTLGERLLTQTRVLWDYIGQLLWPDTPRMGVFHDDYVTSRSLTEPITTLYAVAGWITVALACLVALRWRCGQLLVAAIAFFLLGHAMESSVFSLELYFEHRNYFPGVGIFLLLLAALGCVARAWPQTAAPLIAWLALGVLLLALQSGSQVQVWSSSPLLRLNHVVHHPDSARANEEMALHLAAVGALDAALVHSQRAAALSSQERTGDRQLRDFAMYCMAGQPVPEAVIARLGKVNPTRPFAMVASMYGVAKILASGQCAREEYLAFADRMAQVFLSADSVATASANFYAVLGGMENDLQRFENAYAYMEKSLALKPQRVNSLLMQLHFSLATGRLESAERLKAQLAELMAQGRLTREQTATFELYQ